MKKFQTLAGLIALATAVAFSSCKKEDNFLAPAQVGSTEANTSVNAASLPSSTANTDTTACRCFQPNVATNQGVPN